MRALTVIGSLLVVAFLSALLAGPCRCSQMGEVTAALGAPPYSTGLAWDGKSLWLCDRDREWIYAVDRTDGSFTDSLRCPSFSPLGLVFGDGFLWVSGYEERVIYKVDMEDRRVTDVISAPGEGITGLAWQDGALWACDASEKKIRLVDPSDGTPIRDFKAPSPSSNGLAFDGKYLWVSDRARDRIYMVDPDMGYVITALASPGPYPRGLAWDGKNLWNVDYETDSLYCLAVKDVELGKLSAPKRARIAFTFKAKCGGPDPVDECHIYLALPHHDLEHQRLLSELSFEPEPTELVKDQWNQEIAHFVLHDISPGETRRVSYKIDAEISAENQFVTPDGVGSIHQIPADLRGKYTVDGSRLLIGDPYIQDAIEKAVGDEKNPYWIVRRIFEYINARLEYERVGGWDTAPNVLKRGTGSCSEYSIVFMAMARGAGIPTRFCGGVCERGDEASMDDVFHRWTEVYLPGYGWVPVDASGGDAEWQADCVRAIGSYPNRILITTTGGGDSKYLGWGYNYSERHAYSGRTSLETAAYADWEPIAEQQQ